MYICVVSFVYTVIVVSCLCVCVLLCCLCCSCVAVLRLMFRCRVVIVVDIVNTVIISIRTASLCVRVGYALCRCV